MRRVAPKGTHGDGVFQRITWDEALDEIVPRLKRRSPTSSGRKRSCPTPTAAISACLNNGSMDMRFFHRLGASQLHRSICSETGGVAMISIYGRKDRHRARTVPPLEVHHRVGREHSRQQHSSVAVHRRGAARWRQAGGDRSLSHADRRAPPTGTLPINPGTDVALAMGMMHVIVREGWHDADYIARYSEGFDELEKRLPEYTPERVAQIDRHRARRHREAGTRIRYGAAGGDTPELRYPALAERWRGGACGLHAAGDHGIV